MPDMPPAFSDPAVQAAIARDDAAWQERSAMPRPGDELPGAYGGDEYVPLLELPKTERTVPPLGVVTLNVMHNGAPALRDFNAGPAYPAP